ncbi:hypothetical protein GH714_000238 [Hevea brasiliensis]|uniref:Leucine-rich repeat-containing N-terminal plant-type domain-containing protein n=1 Tax=Hevea brasiliensis TaxID=3981 RepID=A0A6A6KBG4_HEVBR|nr:hypothetical protein GH714_000238 [Hevea brasiliensis]
MFKLSFPFLNLFLSLLLTSIPFLVISQNVNTELDILLKLKQQRAIHRLYSPGPPHPRRAIGRRLLHQRKVTSLLLSDKDIKVTIRQPFAPSETSPFWTCPITTSPENFQELFSIAQSFKAWIFLKIILYLTKLQYLYLNSNQFNGTLPNEIGYLANLVELGLAYNGFVPSPIPAEFGMLSKLTFMWIRNANLIGLIPDSFANLSSLKQLDLAINNVEGSIPGGLFLLKNLTYLYLFLNKLSGEIPQKVEAWNLVEIDLAMNNLTGSIPEDFGKLQNLKLLNLYRNQFSGEIPSSIGLISTLKTFKVFTNNLSGVLPPELGLHSKLEFFEVSANHFSGQLPENLCAGGELPSSLAWNFSRLELNNNKFSGAIPVGISRWVNLIVFEASNNMFSGEIPVEVTSLSRLNTLMLDGNQLSGQLPTKIISWKLLTTLNLSRNALSGQIPAVMGSIPVLLYLDLSQNHFSGKIPSELGQLKLLVLNLSSNQLSGQIPGQFDNFAYENGFLNNSNLCAANPVLNLPNCYISSHNSNKLSSKVLAMILVFSITISMATAILTLVVVRHNTRKKQNRDLATWKMTTFHKWISQKQTFWKV